MTGAARTLARMQCRALLCVLAVVVCAAPARAGPPHSVESRGSAGIRSGPESLRIEYAGDNDSLWFPIAENGLPYDRWVSASTQVRVRAALPAPDWASRAFGSIALAQNIYTPRTAEVATVQELAGDRPYAGWLGLTLGGELVLPHAPIARALGGEGVTHVGVDLSAGTLGPWSLAGAVQYNAHWTYLRFEGKPLPPVVGWGDIEQAPGLAADALVFAETSALTWRAEPPWWSALVGGAPGFELAIGSTLHAGTHIGTAAGSLIARGGWWGDALDPASALVPVAGYLFARAEARAVGWNAAIDSPLITSGPVARAAPLVGEAGVGAVLRLWFVEASLATVYRSNEVATMPDELAWGQLLWRVGGSLVF